MGSWAYAQQRGLQTINLVLSNLYGPEVAALDDRQINAEIGAASNAASFRSRARKQL